MPDDDVALPRSVCVRLTRRCNAACAFCQAPDTSREVVTADSFGALCSWLRARGVESVKLSGGEPTVRPDLCDTIASGAGAGLKVTVITNGMVLRAAVRHALVLAGAELKFSVHGIGVANDAAFGRSFFDRMVTNLDAARAAGVPCSINTVVTKGNRHEMEPLVRFAVVHRCRKVTFIPFVPRGRGRTQRAEFDLAERARTEVAQQVAALRERYTGQVDVRQIDLRAKPYFVVENDLSLVVESWTEERDETVFTTDEFRHLIAAPAERVE